MANTQVVIDKIVVNNHALLNKTPKDAGVNTLYSPPYTSFIDYNKIVINSDNKEVNVDLIYKAEVLKGNTPERARRIANYSVQDDTLVNDATEASAGWYWQFNLKQGFKHDGSSRTPYTTWINSINENTDWNSANDPCVIELGTE